MVCPSWLVVVVMAHVCVPSFGSACWDNSICNDLSNKEQILECIHICMSAIQNEFPTLTSVKVNSDDDGLLSILLNSVAPGDKILEPSLRPHSNERRSYSMEHFRWGKPPARKRRPIKVFASSLEGGGSSSEGSLSLQARRQLGSNDDDQSQGLTRMMVSSKSNAPFSPQQRKDGTYRMSHFRWGSPPASKRNANFMKLGEEKPQGHLAKLFRNIMVKDLQRIMG